MTAPVTLSPPIFPCVGLSTDGSTGRSAMDPVRSCSVKGDQGSQRGLLTSYVPPVDVQSYDKELWRVGLVALKNDIYRDRS